jgi:D-glycero-D-manno-heptose 1,7-bisphosphate phosphatase
MIGRLLVAPRYAEAGTPFVKNTPETPEMTAKPATPAPAAGAEPRPCVFLDRDGTITREAGYINHPERLALEPGAAAALRRLNQAGVLTVLVTNQAGLARGYFTHEVLLATFEHLKKLLAARGARLDAIYFAPHHPSSPDPRWRDDPFELRKPGLGMIKKACAELPIDMARAYMVGDRYNDITFAHKAGIPGIFVKTGYGLGEYTYQREHWKEAPEFIAENLGGAVRWILADLKKKNQRK